MGCISLPGASGVQWLERDVHRHQRDPGGFIAPVKINRESTTHTGNIVSFRIVNKKTLAKT